MDICCHSKKILQKSRIRFSSDTGFFTYSPNIKTNSYSQVFPLVLSEIGIMCFSPVFRHFVCDFKVPYECEFMIDYLSGAQPVLQPVKNEVSTVIVCNIFPTLFLQLDNFFCKGITRQICSNPRNIGAKKYFDKPDETAEYPSA